MTRATAVFAALVGAVPWLLPGVGAGQPADWPGFRGPDRSGAVHAWPDALRNPANWPERLERRWRVAVGLGHASAITTAAGGRNTVFVFTREEDGEVLRALRPGDGAEVWRASYPAPYVMNRAALDHGPGPKATPEAGGGRIFTLGISGILSAWDAETGALVWRRPPDPRFTAGTEPLYGAGASPLVLDGGERLVVHLGGPDLGLLAVLDAATGETDWEIFGDGPGYVSPALAEVAGLETLLTMTEERILLLDPADGRIRWERPFTTPYDQNVVTPVVLPDGDRVVFAGLGNPTFALRFRAGADGALLAEPLWEAERTPLYMSNPVRAGDRLIAFSERSSGHFAALDLRSGRTLWTSAPRAGENAALLVAGRTVVALTDGAALSILDAAAEGFGTVRSYEAAPSPTWAHPTPLADGLLIKDETHLTRWAVPIPAALRGRGSSSGRRPPPPPRPR